MRQFFAIAVLSVLVFAAGYGVRIWVDQTKPLPPPPQVGGEFADGARVILPPTPNGSWTAPNRAELSANIEHLRPQIDAFRKGLHDIDAEFDKGLQALLTPQQHDFYKERRRRITAAQGTHPHQTGPLTDQEIVWLRDRPLFSAVDHISVQWKLDDLDKDLKFDAAQREKMRDLLTQRRDKFIALVDNVPPPSLALSSLAPVAQRLAEATAAPAPEVKP
jgi:hypothetical protein